MYLQTNKQIDYFYYKFYDTSYHHFLRRKLKPATRNVTSAGARAAAAVLEATTKFYAANPTTATDAYADAAVLESTPLEGIAETAAPFE